MENLVEVVEVVMAALKSRHKMYLRSTAVFLLTAVFFCAISFPQAPSMNAEADDFFPLQWQNDYCGDNDPHTILAMGDSITFGKYVREDKQYTVLLQAMTGMHLVNQGQSGSHGAMPKIRTGA